MKILGKPTHKHYALEDIYLLEASCFFTEARGADKSGSSCLVRPYYDV
jgi:hypothetical protein